MKPEACLEVANRSRKQAETCLLKGNAGRAFAHFLVALKLCPSWKLDLSHHFTSALFSWGETLNQQQRYKDLFNCYEQALEVLPDNEEVLNNLGTHLYRCGHVTEACNYFRRAVACNARFLPARHNLQGSCNFLVERWHFRMLNDSIRNDAYRAAIIRRVLQQGTGSSVLDIGTGTGLLSLFAVEAGAGQVYACDCSSTMVQIAADVLHANGASEKVTLINKLSTDIIIPTDMSQRVSLVVTETVDAGLLGEGILQSLIHAWDHLLLPPGSKEQVSNVGRVVPEAAGVWIVPIECLHIARKYRLLKSDLTQDLSKLPQVQKDSCSPESEIQEAHRKRRELDLSKLRLTAKGDEPYDTEDLNTVPDGYKFLASPCHALYIKFSDRQDMVNWLHGQKHEERSLTCTQPGRVDAIAMWFDLHLDDITTVSSAPDEDSDRDGVHRTNCWDQAIFPLQSSIHVTTGQKLNVNTRCHGGKVSVDICGLNRLGETHTITKLQDAFSASKITTKQNDFPLSENCSSTADSETESSINISTNWKRKAPCLSLVSDMKVLQSCSAGESLLHQEEKGMELKNMQKNYEMTLEKTGFDMVDNSDVLKSGSSSKVILHKVPERDIGCSVYSRLDDCSTAVSQDIVRFLNDELWMEALKKTATHLCQEPNYLHISAVLDLSPFPVLGLHLLMSRPIKLMCVVSSAEDELAVRRVAELNGITTTQLQCVTEKHLLEVLDSGRAQFDIIVAHLVDPSGELKETIFNMIPALRSSLAEGGILLPQHISVMGQLLASDWLAQVSHVQNNSHTCGYDIARFINTYQVSQHLDLNLSTLATAFLSNPVDMLQLSLDRRTYQTTQITSTTATHSGMISAIAYWYNIHFHKVIPAVCTAHPSSHVNQAAILLQPYVSIRNGQMVKLLLQFHQGLIHVEPLSVDGESN